MNSSVLIIDDETNIRRVLRIALEAAGYSVREATQGHEGLAEAAACRPDLILLDLGLPDLDGVEVLKRLREWTGTPTIVLSVRDTAEQKVAALDAGADDYMTKPFSPVELMARLRTAQRHAPPAKSETVFDRNGLQVDLTSRAVTLGGREIKLTATEYALLRFFVRHAGRALTHRQILREVWGPKSEGHRQYLRVYVTHLRHKIEADPARPEFIRTEPGIGYRFLSAR